MITFVLLALLACASVVVVRAQSRELSLADILIALRSKKADPAEKNKLLSEAVKQRGITFSLTPEIEKELDSTGAAADLISAIRSKAVPTPDLNMAATKLPEKEVKPVEDFAFFRARATAEISSGDLSSALNDLDKAVAMKPEDPGTRHDRAMVLAQKNDLDAAVAEYTKASDLAPQDPRNYVGRAAVFEKLNKPVDALNDYQKILAIAPGDQNAAASVIRITSALTKAASDAAAKQQVAAADKKPDPAPDTAVQQPAKTVPDVPAADSNKTTEDAGGPVEAGNLGSYCTDLVKPTYPTAAVNMRLMGDVTVNVTLDEQGKVIEAKAAKGTGTLRGAAETAAQRSKFKPVMKNGKPVRATGYMVYSFKL